MITTFIIQMLGGLVGGLMSLIPGVNTGDSSLTQYSDKLGVLTHSLDGYVPETLILSVLGLIIALRLFFTVFRMCVFLYSLIPFVG